MVGTITLVTQIPPLKPPFSPDSSPVGQSPLDGSKDNSLLPATFVTGTGRLHWDDGIDMNFRKKSRVLRPKDHFQEVLKHELQLPGLNRVHQYLWWCAVRPAPALALHEQIMAQRTVVVTERIGLHLVCPEGRTFVKPLSPFLMDHGFWTRHLLKDIEIYGCAAGFLQSYVWMIQHRSDLEMAKEHRLIPLSVTWDAWTLFVDSIVEHLNRIPPSCVNKRYNHGELKLPMLNAIYRYAPETRRQHYYAGYLLGYGQFNSFWRRNFSWMGLGFLYMTAILTAMQVGLAVPYLADNGQFNSASYGFAIFCIIIPAVVVAWLFIKHSYWLICFSSGRLRKW